MLINVNCRCGIVIAGGWGGAGQGEGGILGGKPFERKISICFAFNTSSRAKRSSASDSTSYSSILLCAGKFLPNFFLFFKNFNLDLSFQQ